MKHSFLENLMSVCKHTKDEHDWICLLRRYETDYSPGHEAWWCRSCGISLVQSIYDNRKYNIVTREPRIFGDLK